MYFIERVLEVISSTEFLIQWFIRHGKRRKFFALVNPDGSPNTEVCSLDSVMFWDIMEEQTPDSFELSNYWMTIIDAEYKDMDRRDLL